MGRTDSVQRFVRSLAPLKATEDGLEYDSGRRFAVAAEPGRNPYDAKRSEGDLPLTAPKLEYVDEVTLAFETNGRGCLGFIVQLPGAYVRAPTEDEALSKVQAEVGSYYGWLGERAPPSVRAMVTQRHQSQLKVEDADCEILLDADREPFQKDEFRRLLGLMKYSGETVWKAYEGAQLKEWVDQSRRRNTFYGPLPSTIEAVMEHLTGTQRFYLSRLGSRAPTNLTGFLDVRLFCADELARLYETGVSTSPVEMSDELWTLKKVLRRFIWHDRIHSKAMARMQARLKEMRLIDSYVNPFRFPASSLRPSSKVKARLIPHQLESSK